MPRPLRFGLAAFACLAASLPAIAAAPDEPAALPPDSPAADEVSTASLLNEMVDRSHMARLPAPWYTCTQFSSYDRASTKPGEESWWANEDHGKFLRVEEKDGRKEHVLMEARGPGAIVRFWSANPRGTLRVYLDGADTPAIEAPMADVLGGKWKVGEPFAGVRSRGYNLYFPIAYAKGCKVTCDENGFYYQINFRAYEPGAAVRTFQPSDLDAPGVKQAGDRLRARPMEGGEKMRGKTVTVGPDKRTASIRVRSGPSAITALGVIVEKSPQPLDLPAFLRQTVVRISFDGTETVWAPLGDFFGSGVGANKLTDFYRHVDTGIVTLLSCYWVMPFEKEAVITVETLGDQTATLTMNAGVSAWEGGWDDRSMHFHATWTMDPSIHTRKGAGTSDFNYAEITGTGVYAGDGLAVFNPVSAWWGEGDEKIYVDREPFPSHFGTGTEDYYGYAWCSPEPFVAPFHSQPRSDGQKSGSNRGHTAVSRVRSLDAIPFKSGLKMDMEVWHWAETDVSYAATTYFYARPGAATNRKPEPEHAKLPIPQTPPPYRIEGAVEFEDLTPAAVADGVAVVPQGGFGDKLWSGDTHAWIQAKKPGDFVEYRVPVDGAEPRHVTLYATRSWDYGTVRVSVNGAPAVESLDLFNGKDTNTVHATGPVDLGAHAPRDGAITLRFELTGANEKARGGRSFFGVDCVVLSPAS